MFSGILRNSPIQLLRKLPYQYILANLFQNQFIRTIKLLNKTVKGSKQTPRFVHPKEKRVKVRRLEAEILSVWDPAKVWQRYTSFMRSISAICDLSFFGKSDQNALWQNKQNRFVKSRFSAEVDLCLTCLKTWPDST